MTTTPFEPHEDPEDAAADPGRKHPPDFGGEDEDLDEVPERAQQEGEAGEPPD